MVATETMTISTGQRVVTAEELGIKIPSEIDIPENLKKGYKSWLEDFKARLNDYLEIYVERQASVLQKARRHSMGLDGGQATATATAEIGAPTFPPPFTPPFCAFYNPFDIFTLSPIHLGGLPPFQPGKIVPGGALTIVVAVLWTNPVPAIPCGWGVPPTMQLGGQQVRVRFEQVNLSSVTNGPDFQVPLFNHPGAPIVIIPWVFVAPASGSNPQLMEVNVTVDVTAGGNPYAAFGTWYGDVDIEPPFLITPGALPQLQHDVPMRYMVFPQ